MKNTFARRSLTPAVVLAATLTASQAQAQTSPWSAYAGPAHIAFRTDASVQANGSTVPGANAQASSNDALAFGLVYAFSSDWSAELALGLPPTSTLTGTGALAGAGTLGQITYGPAVLSLRRALPALGPVRPYLGAGLNYTLVLASKDGFVQHFDARNAWGPVAQAGFEWRLAPSWSLVLDIKKIWASTTATGTLPALGGATAYAKVRLDPLITALTVERRF